MVVNYEGKYFRKVGTDGGEADTPLAQYHQDGDLVWAQFSGGDVRRGALSGTCSSEGVIRFAYSMVLTEGDIISGVSTNTPQILDDGRIRLHEQWERYGEHADTGVSYLEEVR
jgi:hypothetical protein